MAIRIPWSEDEAIIIVDAFYQFKNGNIKRTEAVKNVSERLRNMALHKGLEIDDVYRNTNGISMQMATLEHIYSEGKSGLRSGSKLFREVMNLYVENKHLFQEKLNVAQCIGDKSDMNGFSEFLLNHFTYGIRLDSPIEFMRLKRFYESDTGKECSWSDEEIRKKIENSCFIHEGKGYVLSESACSAILSEIKELRDNAALIIYYDELFEKNEEWFIGHGIFSEDMLKSFIKKYSPDINCKKAYFAWDSKTENELLRDNILAIWGDEVLHDYQDINQILEYVPIEKIKYALANNSCFVWNSMETYTTEKCFLITEEEKASIFEYVDKRVEADGSVSFADIPLQTVFDENYELSETAIYTLVFESCLSEDFERYNHIISKKGQENNGVKLIEKYCLSKDEITIDELFEQWELRTGTHRQAEPLDVAYSSMIRIDASTFVKEDKVKFSEAEIDKALDVLVVGDAIGLKEITSFALFPDCNYSWNLFLLESFCRRFSNTFKYMAVTTNSRNAGAIVRKECKFEYHELLAHVLVTKNIDLTEDIVMDYLYDNGFIARHSYKNIKELIELARTLNEGR